MISTSKRPVPLEHYLYTGQSGRSKDERFLIVSSDGQFITKGYRDAIEAKKAKEKDAKPSSDPRLCVPTLGGVVYCTSRNPSDTYHVALGLGDGMIHSWNTAVPKSGMTTLWNGIGIHELRILQRCGSLQLSVQRRIPGLDQELFL